MSRFGVFELLATRVLHGINQYIRCRTKSVNTRREGPWETRNFVICKARLDMHLAANGRNGVASFLTVALVKGSAADKLPPKFFQAATRLTEQKISSDCSGNHYQWRFNTATHSDDKSPALLDLVTCWSCPRWRGFRGKRDLQRPTMQHQQSSSHTPKVNKRGTPVQSVAPDILQ